MKRVFKSLFTLAASFGFLPDFLSKYSLSSSSANTQCNVFGGKWFELCYGNSKSFHCISFNTKIRSFNYYMS